MIFPDKALVSRLEKCLAQDMSAYVVSAQKLFPENQATSIRVGDGVAAYTGLYVNSTVGVGLNTPVSSDELDSIESFFTSRKLPTNIEITPFVDASLLELLNTRNYHLSSFVNAYTLQLDVMQSMDSNPEITVAPVEVYDGETWVETVTDKEIADAVTDTRLATVAFNREYTTCFLARIGDEPVGASAISIRDGVAILYFTATRNAYRKRGVQTAMIQARLRYAQAQGCDMAFATTLPGNNSMRNVMRAGFQIAYTRFTMQKQIQI